MLLSGLPRKSLKVKRRERPKRRAKRGRRALLFVPTARRSGCLFPMFPLPSLAHLYHLLDAEEAGLLEGAEMALGVEPMALDPLPISPALQALCPDREREAAVSKMLLGQILSQLNQDARTVLMLPSLVIRARALSQQTGAALRREKTELVDQLTEARHSHDTANLSRGTMILEPTEITGICA